MGRKRNVCYEVVLRDGGGGYWLTIEPQHRTFSDEFLLSKSELHSRAVAVVSSLGTVVLRDETTEDGSGAERTGRYFAARAPWANNDYAPPITDDEPTLFDARLMPDWYYRR